VKRITKENFFGIREPKWWTQEAPMVPQLCFEWAIGFGRTKEFYKPYYEVAVFVGKGDYGWQALEEERCVAMARAIHEKFQEDRRYLDGPMNEWKKRWEDMKGKWGRVAETELTDLSNNELADLYQQYYEQYISVFTPALLMEAFVPYSEHLLFSGLEKLGLSKKEAQKSVAILTAPEQRSFVVDERVSLLHIILSVYADRGLLDRLKSGTEIGTVKDKWPEFYRALKKHQEKYFWVEAGYKDTEEITEEEFLSRIIEEVRDEERSEKMAKEELKKLEGQMGRLEEERKHEKERLGISEELESLVDLMTILGGWQDSRKEIGLKSNYYLNVLLGEIAGRIGLEIGQAQRLLPEEVVAWLSKREAVDLKILGAREKLMAFVVVGDEQWALVGEEAEAVWQAVFKEEMVEERSLAGVVASGGRVRGRVKVVLDPKNGGSFTEGDILVTSMTRPEFVPLMKKALAVVTDEGGLTSHAAIVSRELGIPCLVGTKKATKVLRDGDEVEVDASHGVVTKLS